MFKLLFKNMKAKNWISVIAIFLLTLGEVFFMMQIVSYISLLTNAVQNSRENGVAEIWWYGLYMVICAIMMAAIEVIIRFVASSAAASCVTGIRQKMYERVNKFAISDFASFSTESLITRTTNDMQNVHIAWITFLSACRHGMVCYDALAVCQHITDDRDRCLAGTPCRCRRRPADDADAQV